MNHTLANLAHASRKVRSGLISCCAALVLLLHGCHIERETSSDSNPHAEREAGGKIRRTQPDVPGLPLSDISGIPIDTTLGEWRPLGPHNFAGKVYDIAVSAQSPNTIYACYGSGGVWRMDGSNPPARLTQHEGLDRSWNQVAVWAGNDNTVVIGSGSLWSTVGDMTTSVLLSHDGGHTFRDITPPNAGTNQITALEIDPADWRRLYVVGDSNAFRSDDGGTTWRTIYTFDNSSIGDEGRRWPDLAVNPSNFNQILLGHAIAGIVKSDNGGAQWHPVNGPRAVPQFSWSRSHPNIVWLETWDVGADHEVWKSVDYGENWTRHAVLTEFTQGRYDMSIAVNPANPDTLIVANAGYSYSTDGMANHTHDYCCDHVDHSSVAFAPGNAARVYVGSDQGVFVSTTGGVRADSYTRYDVGVLTSHVFSFDISSSAGQRIAIANTGDYLNFIGDVSAALSNWREAEGYEYMAVAASPLDPQLMLTVGGGMRLSRSTDRGQSWIDVDFRSGDVSREYGPPIAFDSSNANLVFMADKQVWRSAQKGAAGSWTSLGPPAATTGNVNLRRMAVAPGDNRVIYVSGDFGSTRIFFTRNSGTSWNSFDSGVPYISDIAADPADPSKLLVSGPFDLRYCANYGATCTNNRANLGPPADVRLNRVIYDATSPGRIYGLGSEGGAFVSRNSGQSWQRIGAMLPGSSGSEMRLRDGRLYVGNSQAVWELRSGSYGQPAVPAPSAAGNAASGFTVSWTPVSGATNYFAFRGDRQVYRGSATRFRDTRLPQGAQPCYQVGAENTLGISTFSAAVCANPSDTIFSNGYDTF
ncbi:MAG: hypothetical protein JNN30_09985 [Rhodanobacteraceae bacterium]|nr:hypothetical protein [Rhodanobacteraceae bacterium]